MPKYSPVIWVEKARLAGFPLRNRTGFEVGSVLVSPRRYSNGDDRYRIMRDVKIGDKILHLTDNKAIIGASVVRSPLVEILLGSEPWYKISLAGFTKLQPALGREVFFSTPFGERLLSIAQEPGQGLFYEKRLRLQQGAYLTKLPQPVLDVLADAYKTVANRSLKHFLGSLPKPTFM